jgi:hypothetical protein
MPFGGVRMDSTIYLGITHRRAGTAAPWKKIFKHMLIFCDVLMKGSTYFSNFESAFLEPM